MSVRVARESILVGTEGFMRTEGSVGTEGSKMISFEAVEDNEL